MNYLLLRCTHLHCFPWLTLHFPLPFVSAALRNPLCCNNATNILAPPILTIISTVMNQEYKYKCVFRDLPEEKKKYPLHLLWTKKNYLQSTLKCQITGIQNI